MSNNMASYNYDSKGRLTSVTFPSGAQALYSYDAMGNRTSVVQVPGLTPTTPTLPTVSALPRKGCGDQINNAMMVLLSSGDLIGWGDNTIGALANGIAAATSAVAQRPVFDPNTTLPPSSATIVDWAFTNANLYVVFSNGWVYSAGANSYGQLGHGDTTARYQLKRIEYFVTNSISINKVWASGSYSSTNGGGCVYFQASTYAMYACGANAAGNLGNASTPTSNVSTPAACSGVPFSTSHATDVAISSDGTNYSTYMLMSDGKLMVAGYNASGQLGTGNTTSVTGSFANAKQTGSTNITTAVQVSVNGGGAVSGSNAMILDSSGYIWSTGNNQFGQLGLGNTTNQNLFTKVTAISNITKVEIGGGYDSYAYAINSSGTFYTWGYNVRNNLFQNNTTSTSTPTAATYVPGTVANAYFARGNNLSTQSQLIVVTTGGKICYAGMDNGMVGIDNTVTSGAYKYIPTPRPILDGTETITDVFVHGSGTSQRLFILTDAGNLYACGANANAICTGGVNSNSMQANVAFSKIAFLP